MTIAADRPTDPAPPLGQPRPTGAAIWWLAIRPKILPASITPIVVGSAVAISEDGFHLITAVVALVVAMALQITSNLANDLFDFQKGADVHRVGPMRITQSGLATPRQMGVAVAVAVACSLAGGVYLVSRGGWPMLGIGLLAILAALAYTGGPYPLGYNGLGDPFVFIFFGLVGVAGSAYVQTGDVTWLAVLCAVPVGCLAVAIIVANNLRDIETDRVAGKRTFAVFLGRERTIAEFAALLGVAYLVPPALWLAGQIGPWWLLTLLSAPLAVTLAARVRTATGRELVPVLIGTSRLIFVYGALFALGIAL